MTMHRPGWIVVRRNGRRVWAKRCQGDKRRRGNGNGNINNEGDDTGSSSVKWRKEERSDRKKSQRID
ncbi:unnamed protein product [Protopolystoma xenopodis]|uniref:Uncharacterized protein n=1 Tax=Protopolystoma xenopodis TaxID=117903 RepID=A0A448WIA2_9PLAT|nr:unnamed protein product [Protopolystoma xenopodis]